MAAAVDKAYLEIREGIVGGRYAPGAHLTAQELATADRRRGAFRGRHAQR